MSKLGLVLSSLSTDRFPDARRTLNLESACQRANRTNERTRDASTQETSDKLGNTTNFEPKQHFQWLLSCCWCSLETDILPGKLNAGQSCLEGAAEWQHAAVHEGIAGFVSGRQQWKKGTWTDTCQ